MDPTLSLARQHLAEALEDPAGSLPDLGPRWGTIAKWSRDRIANFRTVEEAVHFAQAPLGHGGFEVRLRGDALAQLAGNLEHIIVSSFPDAVPHLASWSEPEISDPATTMMRDGRRVAGPMFTHAICWLSCSMHVPVMDYVCEIGGGFGGPARLALTNSYRPAKVYVVIDLPESLFFAETYLRATLGHAAVRYLGAGETIDCRELVAPIVLLCPTTRIAGLAATRFDLVMNTLSMQEMPDAYIDFYDRWLSVQAADHFYSFNYFLQSADDRGESSNLFAPRLSSVWDVMWCTFGAGNPVGFANMLARRADQTTAGFRIQKAIRQHLRRPLQPASVYHLIHAAEISGSAELAFKVMSAVNEDFDYGPKEVLFLAELIEQFERDRPMLDARQRETVASVRDDYRMRLKHATHSEVPPHLVAVQRSLYECA
jgi:putative sugar O-methyltransferase